MGVRFPPRAQPSQSNGKRVGESTLSSGVEQLVYTEWVGGSNPSACTMEGLRILNINCQQGYKAELYTYLNKVLGESDYSFVLLQEVHPRVWEFVRKDKNYDVLGAPNRPCILYRKGIGLIKSYDKSFWAHFGFVVGSFETILFKIIICSFHGHYLNPFKRRREIISAKKELLKLSESTVPIIWAGDFNSSLPGEVIFHEYLSLPFFQESKELGPTLFSERTEEFTRIGRIALFLRKLGIKLNIRADHVYSFNRVNFKIKVRKISDVFVSDHAPIEIRIEKNA